MPFADKMKRFTFDFLIQYLSIPIHTVSHPTVEFTLLNIWNSQYQAIEMLYKLMGVNSDNMQIRLMVTDSDDYKTLEVKKIIQNR